MAAGVFRFKRFEVRNERSAMKVNTDGVLLGAAVSIPGEEGYVEGEDTCGPFEVLDAGTGTGTIALMIAQRLSDNGMDFHVTGIDIDRDSALEAGGNFALAPWSRNMTAIHLPLSKCDGLFDLIVSNPPYYDDSLQNPDFRKNTARHTAAADEEGLEGAPMSFRTLLDFASDRLKDHGTIAVVLPADQESSLMRYARMCGFLPFKTIRVHTTDRKDASRIIAQFRRKTTCPSTEAEGQATHYSNHLLIQSEGKYTDEYRSLMKNFYLWA